MTERARDFLRAEIAALEDLLATVEEGHVIERMSLEARKKQVEEELAALAPAPPRITLTFRGDPVVGTRAILAEFGGTAAALFSDAVAMVSAGLSGQLGKAGPVPQRAERELRIVGTAPGSFGFELELPPVDQEAMPGLLPDMSDSVQAAVALIREAEAGNQDALSELIAEIQPRAAAKVHAFVKHVVDRNASFALSFGEHRAAIRTADEGRAVLEALREDQIQEAELVIDGALTGVLPDARRFEAQRAADKSSILRGRIDRAVGDPYELLHTWLGKPARLTVRETKVRSAPSYVLLAIDTSECSE